VKKFLTTTKNINLLQRHIPVEHLPQTFTDAIQVAHELGFAYLWIDALCIQHDSKEDLHEQIERMGDIYSGSSLTIFAAAGEHSRAGLGAGRDPSISLPSKTELHFRAGNWAHEGQYLISEFCVGKQQPELPLYQRGWVLQEEILSARALSFESDEMTWRCLCETLSERRPGCTSKQDLCYLDDIMDQPGVGKFMRLRLLLRAKNPLPTRYMSPTYGGRGGLLDEWYSMVMNYSGRQLSFPSDVLPALSGIASAVTELHKYTYVAGLWQEDLQLGLIWQTGPTAGESTTETPRMLRRQARAGDYWENLGYPSWSWISQFRYGRSIRLDHRRKYVLDEQDGLQVLDVKVTQPPLYSNPFGKVVSASLKILARAKWAKIPVHERRHQRHGEGYQLVDREIDTTNQEAIGEFHPDCPDAIESLQYVLCILCAVARAQRDGCLKTPTVYTAIGVVPSSAPFGFARVGLVKILKEDWFGKTEFNCTATRPWARLQGSDNIQVLTLV
jgi:hypothetical protein